MRVNVYAEEMTDRIEIIGKEIDGHRFTGLRFYLELPVTVGGAAGRHRSEEGPGVFPPIGGEAAQIAGPFMHRPGDDDSAAVTFWGKRDLRDMMRQALAMLDAHYDGREALSTAVATRDPIETINDSLVTANGDEILIMRPRPRLTKAEALRLAAYLVVLADPSGGQFAAVLDAVRST